MCISFDFRNIRSKEPEETYMAFDGITTAAVVHELNTKLSGGGISRIVQSEKDELILTVKSNKVTYRVLLSASASLPLIYITPFNKQAPLTAEIGRASCRERV